jgi:hypothetical protein
MVLLGVGIGLAAGTVPRRHLRNGTYEPVGWRAVARGGVRPRRPYFADGRRHDQLNPEERALRLVLGTLSEQGEEVTVETAALWARVVTYWPRCR